MERKLEVGKERDFLKFIENISSEDKIALITHTDLDGIASAKVVEKCLKIDFLKFVDYSYLNSDLISELENNGFNKIILTDIGIDNVEFIKNLEKFAEVLIIDHHEFSEDFNSDKTVFINTQGYCAAFLCYYLFSKIKSIEVLDWVVACACLADFQYKENKEWMKKVYEKYGKKFISSDGGIKIGKFWRITGDITFSLIYFNNNLRRVYDSVGEGFADVGDLEKYANIIRKEIDKTKKKFWKEKKEIGDICFWKVNLKYRIKSIIINIVSMKYKDRTFIFISRSRDKWTISSRRQDRKVDLPKLLKKLIKGFENAGAGGHIPAAGGYFMDKDLREFEKRVGNLK